LPEDEREISPSLLATPVGGVADDVDGVCWGVIGRLDVLPVLEAPCFPCDVLAFGDGMKRAAIDTFAKRQQHSLGALGASPTYTRLRKRVVC
jgi:hypothetical protein